MARRVQALSASAMRDDSPELPEEAKRSETVTAEFGLSLSLSPPNESPRDSPVQPSRQDFALLSPPSEARRAAPPTLASPHSSPQQRYQQATGRMLTISTAGSHDSPFASPLASPAFSSPRSPVRRPLEQVSGEAAARRVDVKKRRVGPDGQSVPSSPQGEEPAGEALVGAAAAAGADAAAAAASSPALHGEAPFAGGLRSQSDGSIGPRSALAATEDGAATREPAALNPAQEILFRRRASSFSRLPPRAPRPLRYVPPYAAAASQSGHGLRGALSPAEWIEGVSDAWLQLGAHESHGGPASEGALRSPLSAQQHAGLQGSAGAMLMTSASAPPSPRGIREDDAPVVHQLPVQRVELPEGYQRRGRQRRGSVSAESDGSARAAAFAHMAGTPTGSGSFSSESLADGPDLAVAALAAAAAASAMAAAGPVSSVHPRSPSAMTDAEAGERFSVNEGSRSPSQEQSERRRSMGSHSLSERLILATPPRHKPPAVLQRISRAVSHIFLFAGLHSAERLEVFQSMRDVAVPAGTTVIEQGEEGQLFYVIESGRFEAIIRDEDGQMRKTHEYENSGAFGELALMYFCPRSATVRAVTHGSLWCIDRETFRRCIVESGMRRALKAQRFIESCLLLAPLSPFERSALIDALEVHEFRDGECVIRQGQASGTPFFFFVESGRARVTRFSGEPASSPVLAPAVMPALPPALIAGPPSPREEEVGVIGPGGFFGEVSILTGRPRTANVYALGPLTCLVVPPTAFSELIWRNCSDAMRKESARYRFSASFHPPPTPTLAPGPKAASPLVRSTSSPLE